MVPLCERSSEALEVSLLQVTQRLVGNASNLHHADLQTLEHVTYASELRKVVFSHNEDPNSWTRQKKEVGQVADNFHEYYNYTMGTFMPGFSVSVHWKSAIFIFLLIVILWFTLFIKFIYQMDREELESDRWSKHLAAASEYLEAIDELDLQVRPDIMLVFHHPQHECKDNSSKVSAGVFEQIIDSSLDPTNLQRTSELRKVALTNALAAPLSKQDTVFGRVAQTLSMSMAGTEGPTFCEARIALMQDLYQGLIEMGLSVQVFSSFDEDKIFFSVKLSKPEVIRAYLEKQNYPLRVNKGLIPKLGISQPPNAPAPMLVYDPRTIEDLHNVGVIPTRDEAEVYQMYRVGKKTKLISRRDRIRMIYEALSKWVDLDAAVSTRFLVAWYPVHNVENIPKLKASWGNAWLLLDTSFVQPVLSIQRYFGVRVAFIFAWNGLYCKALFALLPLALVAVFFSYAQTGFWHTGGTRMMIAFNTVVIVWSRIAYNLWRREEAYFQQVWNVHEIDGDEQSLVRPSFHGTKMPATHDSNKLEKRYPERLSVLRSIVSFFVTIFFCSLVAVLIVTWYEIFEGHLTLKASILLVIQMKVFEVWWNAFTPVLTEFENHKYNATYFNSYIWKNFGFMAVNKYGAFLYLAFKLQHSKAGCPDGHCVAMLQGLLINVQFALFLASTASLMVNSYWMKFILWYEFYKYRKATDGEEPPDRPRSEEEARMPPFRKEDQINLMCRLMLSLGFVILFGGIVPIMVPLCLLLFALNLRLGAQALLDCSQRPFPHKLLGIGAWKEILLILMQVGVLFSGFMMVVNGKTFSNAPVITKLTGFMFYCIAMFVAWRVVDRIMPPTSKDTRILKRQNECVLREIHSKCRNIDVYQAMENFKSQIKRKATLGESVVQSPIIRAAWSEIRPLGANPLKQRSKSSYGGSTLLYDLQPPH